MTDHTRLVLDDQGIPSAIVDVERIEAAATALGFDLAVAATSEHDVEVIMSAVLADHGPAAFGYVTAAALRHVTTNILAPVLEVARAHGTDLTPRLIDAARTARETV